jgi:hypothetical protein
VRSFCITSVKLSMSEEIKSLNLNDIDVEELERRIELGQLVPGVGASIDDFHCGTFLCGEFVAK